MSAMPELLLELGCEELPATFVAKASDDLLNHLTTALTDAGVLVSRGVRFGTPRRLIVSFPDLIACQPDSTKEQRGPALKAAYDSNGNATPALIGFCRSQGVSLEELRKDDQYVWVTKLIKGLSTAELLKELVPKAIRSLTFEKTMRWGLNRMRFARPIRWIVALLDGEIISFDIEGVFSGKESRGHRFYAPQPFEVHSLEGLIEGLRVRKVEPDSSARRQAIVDQSQAVANGVPDLVEALVEENTYLTEWPTAIQGAFREEFMALPEPVLVTAMAKHEKMFPIRDAEGRLTNRFVFIRNSGEDDTVRAGCSWVLNARFNDAKFFFDEDSKFTLEEFLEKTSTIVFQEKLGTVRARANRLANLAEAVALATGADAVEIKHARQAGLFAKADLSTGLVGELTSLQGIIGGQYAHRDNLDESVQWALATQYDLGKNPLPMTPAERTAVRLVIADQLDKMAGYLGLGLSPTGSSDPFALRRAATLLIEAAWNWPGELPTYEGLFDLALGEYESQGVKLGNEAAVVAFRDVFASRYGSLLPEVRYDVLESVLAVGEVTRPQDIRFRTGLVEALVTDPSFVQTATRPINIVASAAKKGIQYGISRPLEEVVPANLQSAEGEHLHEILRETEPRLASGFAAGSVEDCVSALREVQKPINAFFESTMIMAEEEIVRFARLTLLNSASQVLFKAGDFSKIVIDG
jgi:glycyl-tRNA synthetase beta chain